MFWRKKKSRARLFYDSIRKSLRNKRRLLIGYIVEKVVIKELKKKKKKRNI